MATKYSKGISYSRGRSGVGFNKTNLVRTKGVTKDLTRTRIGNDLPRQAEKWNSEVPRMVYEICLLGATDSDICRILGIPQKTFTRWKGQYPALQESLRQGRELADSKVAAALYKRATGYTYSKSHITAYMGDVTITRTTEYEKPDVQAGLAWLRTRQKQYWSEPDRVTKSLHLNLHQHSMDLSDISTEELKLMEKLGMKNMLGRMEAEAIQDNKN